MLIEVQINYTAKDGLYRSGYSRTIDPGRNAEGRVEHLIHQVLHEVEGRHAFTVRIYDPRKPQYEDTLARKNFNRTANVEARLKAWIMDQLEPYLFQAAVEDHHG